LVSFNVYFKATSIFKKAESMCEHIYGIKRLGDYFNLDSTGIVKSEIIAKKS